MVIYPIQETKTDYTSFPWATLVLMIISVAGFLGVHHKLNREADRNREATQIRLNTAVEMQFQKGELDQKLWIAFREDPTILSDPKLASAFSPEARRAWINVTDQTPPMLSILRKTPTNLLYAITAHHLLPLLVGLFSMMCIGFLLEHQYDRQIILALFATCGCSWLIVGQVLPAEFTPSPIFAWSQTVMVFLTVGFLTAPKANITLALRGWFIRVFGGEFEVPAIIFPAMFLCTHVITTLYLSPLRDWFSMLALAAVALEAVVFALLLVLVPNRPPLITLTPSQQMDRDLAQVKVFYDTERDLEGLALLRKVIIAEPGRKHLHAAADLAWQYKETDLADQCYRSLLRRTQADGEDIAFLDTVGEMLFRRMKVGGNYLLRATELATDAGKLSITSKYLPHVLENNDIAMGDKIKLMERLAQITLRHKEPDRRFLLTLQKWLEQHHSESDVLILIQKLFQSSSSESKLTGSFTTFERIHRLVDVDLLAILPEKLLIQVKGQKAQHIPWTAAVGAFGCHITGNNRGYRGCLIVRFKRKIFGCVITTSRILIKDGAEPMTFETMWALLKRHIPEDLPLLDMKDFPQLKDESQLLAEVETFLNEGVGVPTE